SFAGAACNETAVAGAAGVSSRSNRRNTEVGATASCASGTNSDDGIVGSAAQVDLLLLSEPPRDRDDVRLRFLDVLETDRPHGAEVVLEDLDGARRHVAEYLVLHHLARGLEAEQQVLARQLLQERLHAAVVEAAQVLERQHEVTDVLRQLGRRVLE